jgi:hypothetical protein
VQSASRSRVSPSTAATPASTSSSSAAGAASGGTDRALVRGEHLRWGVQLGSKWTQPRSAVAMRWLCKLRYEFMQARAAAVSKAARAPESASAWPSRAEIAQAERALRRATEGFAGGASVASSAGAGVGSQQPEAAPAASSRHSERPRVSGLSADGAPLRWGGVRWTEESVAVAALPLATPGQSAADRIISASLRGMAHHSHHDVVTMLSRPAGARREYHDDITATVVFLPGARKAMTTVMPGRGQPRIDGLSAWGTSSLRKIR